MAYLRITKGGSEVQSIDLKKIEKPMLSLGRATDADIRLEDRAIGREHAVFKVESQGVVLQKKSKFGKLSVNGIETSEAVLKPGDVIHIADYLLKFEDEKTALPMSSVSLENLDAPDLVAEPDQSSAALKIEPTSPGAALAKEINSVDQVAEPQELQSQPIELPMSQEDRTMVFSSAELVVKLVFKPGEANVEELELKKDETAIGRGTACDVILTDKNASRKHLVIAKVGANFIARDQGSGNGTYVNGEKITEKELSGNDVIRIGETEFTFKAQSQEYFEGEKDFIAPHLEEPVTDSMATEFQPDATVSPDTFTSTAQQPAPAVSMATIPGLGPSGQSKGKETLLEKFKRQPLPRKILIAGVVGYVVFMALTEEEPAKDAKKKEGATTANRTVAATKEPSFEALNAERKQFVVNSYQLAFDLYKNREYERAIYEVDKILQILPGGYKDAKEIKIFAQKSIEIQRANEEERRRKETEEKLRREVAELVALAETYVNQGKDAEASDIFAKVLEKDPDNPTILRLRQTIEDREAKKKAALEAEQDKKFKERQFDAILSEGRALLSRKEFYPAIEKMQEAKILFASDKKRTKTADKIIDEAKKQLHDGAAPHLKAASDAFESGDYTTARDAYYKALKVDFKNAAAKDGLDKIRSILHERAKAIFADAAILESISRYAEAKAKYKECMNIAMEDDKYFGMCSRKYKRFKLINRGTASDLSAGGGGGGDLGFETPGILPPPAPMPTPAPTGTSPQASASSEDGAMPDEDEFKAPSDPTKLKAPKAPKGQPPKEEKKSEEEY